MAQTKYTIQGSFDSAVNQEIKLMGFNSREAIPLSKTSTDSKGNFTLEYLGSYVGAAVLESANGKKVIVLLNHENFEMRWVGLNTMKNLVFTHSPENVAFDGGLYRYQKTEEKKNGIRYLLPLYADDDVKSKFLKKELDELESAMPNFLKSLPVNSYASYYLKLRILLADLQLSAKRYPDRLPMLLKEWDTLDFSDKRLRQSGLYEDLLENFVITVENLDDKNKKERLNSGITAILKSLSALPEIKQLTAEYLFNFLEKRSLFDASEKLALAMLNDSSCQLDEKHTALFEQYRKMAIGKTAPEIQLNGNRKLYDFKNKYKLVVFGASWCPKCVEEIPHLKTYYTDWKNKTDLEIVFISLDTQKPDYKNFIQDFPWISNCDFKSWETQAVKDYCVFGTPTMYLLDTQNTIVLKPISADQINSWLKVHP